jgi:threonine dehydrogenase-like Zn-dependent dehydrogenase
MYQSENKTGDGLTPSPLLTHTFPLEKIADAYQPCGERSGGVLKVVIKP